MPVPCPSTPVTGTSSGVGVSFGTISELGVKPDHPDGFDLSLTVTVNNTTGVGNGPELGLFTVDDELLVWFALVPPYFDGASGAVTFHLDGLHAGSWPTFAKYGFRMLSTITMTGAWTATFSGTISWIACELPDVAIPARLATIVG